MRLLVTGASSFVGAHFCVRASARHEVLALHHSTPLRLNQMTPIKADLRTKRDRARVNAEQFDVVVHLATKVKGSSAQQTNRALMDSVLSFGRPVIYASSTVVHWDSASPYRESRREDEQRLAESGLDWVVVRPSAPYGPKLLNHQPRHKESFHTLADWVQNSPIVPVIGDGRYRRQPIHVHDFADAMLAFVDRKMPGRAFDAGGSQALSFNDIIDTIAATANRRVRKLHLPKALFVQMARLSEDFDPDLIGSVDEDEVADMYNLSEATGVRLRPFSEGARCLI